MDELRTALCQLVVTGATSEYPFGPDVPRHAMSVQWRYPGERRWHMLGFTATWSVDEIENWARELYADGSVQSVRTIVECDNVTLVDSVLGGISPFDFSV